MTGRDARIRIADLVDPSSWLKTEPLALLALRWLVGAFLIWGVWDNIVSAERMTEFAGFLAAHGFPAPEVLAPVSVAAQLGCGLAFISGFCVRWAGLICAVNFAVALAMVDAKTGIRGGFPSACLICIGLLLAARGGGPLSLDALLFRSRL